MYYTIPESLKAEIDELEARIGDFRAGRLDASSFKVRRVPFGVYEQRKDDTYMVRIRCPGGAITPEQLRTVAELSQKYAADSLHVTTRQELQIHNVALENVIPIMRRLLEVRLSTRGGGGNTVRNIIASVDSGISREEVFDVAPYAFALTTRLIGEPDSWLLTRKYKIAFANSAEDNARAGFNDLGFIAKVQNGVRGFEVYVAGGLGTKPQVGQKLYDFVPHTEVYFIAEAIKRLFNQHGNRKNRHAARLRFLWNNLGETKFRELFEKEMALLREQKARPLALPSGYPTVMRPALAPEAVSSPEFHLWRERYVTPQAQPGLCSVFVPLFLGDLPNKNALALADFLDGFGADVLRATLDQNLSLRNIPEAFLGNVFNRLQEWVPLSTEPRFVGSSVACTGAATCKLGICLPRGALSAITRKLKSSQLDLDRLAGFRLNLSGCPNTCGDHLAADLGFFGKVARKGQTPYPAYGIVVGGTLGQGKARLAQPAGDVSARELPVFVSDFLLHYLEAQRRFHSYAEYLELEGKAFIKGWCAQHREIPDFEDDKNYYYDWTAAEVFSLAARGVGECSAGLFDLIEFDLKRLKELKSELPEQRNGQRAETLYQIALSAARMLLITRGVEAKSDADVFIQHRRHFVDAGLVDRTFVPVLEAAQARNLGVIESLADEVLALVQAMEELYGKMDNSLKFPGETSKVTSQAVAAVAQKPQAADLLVKDFRGVTCPMNFVKTKLALSSLKSGERLKVLLDDGAPIQNVPRSVAEEGHKIIEQTHDGAHWTVLIEKR